MRKQTVRIKTGKMGHIIVAAVVSVLICVGVFGSWYLNTHKKKFSPPEYDKNVQAGLPQADKNMNYGSVTAPTGFSVGLCGTMYQQQDGSLILDITNPEVNDVNIQCEVKDNDGNTLYKSGVVEPGHYVEKLSPQKKFANKAIPITILVYGYEPDSWYSRGTIELQNTLQPY